MSLKVFTIEELCNLDNRKKKDVINFANYHQVSPSTVYRWMKKHEEKALRELGQKTLPVSKITKLYRNDPDYNNIIDQEISHYKPILKGFESNPMSRIRGFDRRYLTIKLTYDMIVHRIKTINFSRDEADRLPIPSYQAIWKRIKKQ